MVRIHVIECLWWFMQSEYVKCVFVFLIDGDMFRDWFAKLRIGHVVVG